MEGYSIRITSIILRDEPKAEFNGFNILKNAVKNVAPCEHIPPLSSISRSLSMATSMSNWKLPSFKQDEKSWEAKFGDKKICIITGTSSGLGKHTTKSLLESGEFHVIGAVRDLDKMTIVAEEEGLKSMQLT